MTDEKATPEPETRWAYAYELDPSLPEDQLADLEALLAREHAMARGGERTWASRLVLEERVTHILVVSDTPQQDLLSNRRLENKLRDLKAGFTVTAPMRVDEGAGR